VLQGFLPAGIDIDDANRLGFARVFRTILALLPRRVNAADEVKTGVGPGREVNRLLSLADAEILGGHGDCFSFRRPESLTSARFGVIAGLIRASMMQRAPELGLARVLH